MKKLALAFATILMASPLVGRAQLQEDGSFKIAAGTVIDVRLLITLSTRTNKEGDPFSAKLVQSVMEKGIDIIPEGSVIEGRVTYAKQAGKIKGKSEMRLVADSIMTPEDEKYMIVASLEGAQGIDGAKVKDKEGTIEGGGTSAKGGAIEAGIGTGAGAAIGGIAAGGTGALYGAGIGLVAASVRHLFKAGKDVTLPIGTEMTFVISRDSFAQKVQSGRQEASEPESGPPVLKRDESGPARERE